MDLDGDCLAGIFYAKRWANLKIDLFFICQENDTSTLGYQVLVNSKADSYRYSQNGTFPEGSGLPTFADIGDMICFVKYNGVRWRWLDRYCFSFVR